MTAVIGLVIFFGAIFILRALGPTKNGTQPHFMKMRGAEVLVALGCTSMFAVGAALTIAGLAPYFG